MGETDRGTLRRRAAHADRAADDRRARPARRRASRRPRRSRTSAPTDPEERAGHTYGKSFRDVWRGAAPRLLPAARPRRVPARRGRHRRAARLVQRRAASPRSPTAAARRSSAASSATSTTTYRGAVSIDLRALDQVLEIDRDVARGAHPGRRLRPRARGPAAAARPDAAPLPAVVRVLDARRLDRDALGRSLRDAAHAHRRLRRVAPGGHAARRLGEPAAARVPAPGRRPTACSSARKASSASSPRRGCGSRTARRSAPSATARFSTFAGGVEAARAIAQSGPAPGQLPAARPARGAAHRRRRRGDTLLLLAFESADHPLDAWIARAVECVRDHGGRVDDDAIVVRDDGRRPAHARARPGAGATRSSRAVHARRARRARRDQRDVRDRVHLGPLRRAPRRGHDRGARHRRGRGRAAGGRSPAASRTCIPTAPRRTSRCSRSGSEGEQLAQWEAIKAAAADALIRSGGTITHHHAVGRDHRRWYDRQRPEPFAAALRAAKRALDPAGILNPGVLIDP